MGLPVWGTPVLATQPHHHIPGCRAWRRPEPDLSAEGVVAVSTTYRAEVYREDGWWMVRVPQLDLLTQAETWSEVERMGRGVIAADQDLDLREVTVEFDLLPDPETVALLAQARASAEEAERLRAEALAANQAAARRLRADGWSYRLIGRALRLTHQRAEQLVKGTR